MKAADRRGLTCMQEKTKHHLFFFYLHKLPFAAAIKNLFFPPTISKARFSGKKKIKNPPSSHLLLRFKSPTFASQDLSEKNPFSFLFR